MPFGPSEISWDLACGIGPTPPGWWHAAAEHNAF
jgi:hypothetical protein